ncbi:HNH endonuclease signature motif containing protein [Evansella sp. AB-rgal1]|uniref:HNH endonuclease signature motif containing protein n=1 Tax=Evansella sp. AB-rgal1 TaxID=3242696 RepID=UPI00359DDD9F
MIYELQSIDFKDLITDEIKLHSEEMTLENTEFIIQYFDENLSIEESLDKIVEKKFHSIDNTFTTQGLERDILDDSVSFAIEKDEELALEPENILLDSSIALNIIVHEGEDIVIKELGEFVDELVNQKEESYSFIQKKSASAAQSGLGYFSTLHNAVIANYNTTNAKLVTTGKITRAGGVLKPIIYRMNLESKRKTSRTGSYTYSSSRLITNAILGTPYKLESPISKTYYWQTYATFTGTFKNGSKKTTNSSTDRVLINKKGVPYPTYKDSKSGKVMTEPSSTTWVKNPNPVAWTTKMRNDYLDWYEKNYGKITRSDFQVHHIRPRAYNGSHNYDNLIPLRTDFHTKTVTPWWTNY